MPTVFSIIRKPDLTPWPSGRVVFRPAKPPWFRTPDVVVDYDVELITDTAGFFTQALASGYYWVWIGTSAPFPILVPESELTYLLVDLRSDGARTPTGLGTAGTNYQISDGVFRLVNADTGLWHPIWLQNLDGDDRISIGEPTDEPDEANYAIQNTTTLVLKNITTEAWQPPSISGTDPSFAFAVGSVGDLPANYRVLSSAFQLANLETGKWHTIFITGTDGAYSLAIGDEMT